MNLSTRSLKSLLVLSLIALLAAPAMAARKTEKKEPLFPDATRQDREPKVQSRYSKQQTAMSKANDKDDYATLIAKSLEIVNDAKAKADDRGLAYQNAAYGAMEQDDLELALEYLTAAIETDALSNDTHFQLMIQVAQIHIGEERYTEGLAMLDRFLTETKSTKPDYFALKGNALYRLDRFEEASVALEQAIKTSDKPQDGWRQILMAAYFDQQKPEEAARVAQELAASNPDDKRSLTNLAAIFSQADQLDKAVGVLEDMRSKGMFNEDRDYRQLYAMYLNMDGKESQAAAVIEEGLKSGVLLESSDVYGHLAQAYYFSDQFDQAIVAYQKAVPLGKDGEPGLNLARVLLNEGRDAEARDAAKAAIGRGLKKPGDAWLIIGRAEYGLQNNAAMIAAYREAAKLPETKVQAEEWLRKSGKL